VQRKRRRPCCAQHRRTHEARQHQQTYGGEFVTLVWSTDVCLWDIGALAPRHWCPGSGNSASRALSRAKRATATAAVAFVAPVDDGAEGNKKRYQHNRETRKDIRAVHIDTIGHSLSQPNGLPVGVGFVIQPDTSCALHVKSDSGSGLLNKVHL
jgi:hypothetical protein